MRRCGQERDGRRSRSRSDDDAERRANSMALVVHRREFDRMSDCEA